MESFIVGQRWINSAELTLGLGTVIEVEFRTITVEFPATGDTRTYAKQTAPLNRVVFSEGDSIEIQDGQQFTVHGASEEQGLITYHCENDQGTKVEIHELLLNHHVQLSRPTERLFNLQIDRNSWFRLRQLTRHWSNTVLQSDLYGLCGCRTSLIPHQLYIAHEVAQRFAPRVLLADEVGLGKTIEAGLILHQQVLTDRAQRILIIVPETLTHQWLVEMMRRFNLMFSIFDETRCLASDEQAEDNPFHSAQFVLCSIHFLSSHPQRFQQALAGQWDLLVVDEAHHLEWTESQASIEYQMVEQLSLATQGVLLLTATPEQLGKESHFARLRLLDHDRFSDLQSFITEEQHYQPIAEAVDLLLSDSTIDSKTLTLLESMLNEGDNAHHIKTIEDPASRQILVNHLLDRHGTGRILFRNTRATVKGFPKRQLTSYPMTCPEAYCAYYDDISSCEQSLLSPEHRYSQNHPNEDWTLHDPRVAWLTQQLHELRPAKVLVIAAHKDTALSLAEALDKRGDIHAAVFHEGMSLIERDRAAAYFADDYGTQVLICSEIGSEGRNFQFAHHMVLFDLPINPDLLEQRIGRLDRIGQTETIQIHVPYLSNSPQAVYFNWCHHGINAFEQTSPAAHSLFEEFESELIDCFNNQGLALDELIQKTQLRQQQVYAELQQGRDKLLEYNSCRYHEANTLVVNAEEAISSQPIADYMEIIFDVFGIHSEAHSQECIIIKPGDHMLTPLPGLPEDGMVITYDRETALAFEDVHYITWEHPLVRNAMEIVLSQEMGNAAVTAISYKGVRPGTLILETHYVLEPTSNLQLHVNRYLPTTSIQLFVDEFGNNHELDQDYIKANKLPVKRNTATQIIQAKIEDIKQVVNDANELAQIKTPELLNNAKQQAETFLTSELNRLRALQLVNPSVRPEELAFFETQLSEVTTYINSTKPRLDAIRVIVTT